MTVDDHNALVIIGKHMAATNGYRPEQASDLYLTSGTTRDYEYGTYRIFSYTFEMSVKDYPDDSLIASETGRNKEAVLYLMERACCPLGRARGGGPDRSLRRIRRRPRGQPRLGGQRRPHRHRAGATWQRGDPAPTTYARSSDAAGLGSVGPVRRSSPGSPPGPPPRANDVDGGRTSVTSPAIDLPNAAGQKLQFRWTFAHDARATSADELRVEVLDVGSGNAATPVLVVPGAPVVRSAGWRTMSIDLSAYAGKTIRLRFSATDAGVNGVVEAGFDDVRVTQPQ